MILIGENIHIISKQVREALENRDENFIKNLIKIQDNMDCIDINIGLAKGKLDKIFEWIIPLVSSTGVSFDTTNTQAIEDALRLVKNPEKCFINSTTNDEEKLQKLVSLSVEYGCNLIALSMSKNSGIPKTSDEKMEMVFEIYENCIQNGLSPEKIFFDPLVLPVKVDQPHALTTIDTIRMIKESFDPKVMTVVGLSNISNGCPNELRPLINRVYGAIAYGAGLDAVIMNAKDTELVKMFKVLDSGVAENSKEELYLKLAQCIRNFGDINEIEFDENDISAQNIIKTARVLMNEDIYSDNFTRV